MKILDWLAKKMDEAAERLENRQILEAQEKAREIAKTRREQALYLNQGRRRTLTLEEENRKLRLNREKEKKEIGRQEARQARREKDLRTLQAVAAYLNERDRLTRLPVHPELKKQRQAQKAQQERHADWLIHQSISAWERWQKAHPQRVACRLEEPWL